MRKLLWAKDFLNEMMLSGGYAQDTAGVSVIDVDESNNAKDFLAETIFVDACSKACARLSTKISIIEGCNCKLENREFSVIVGAMYSKKFLEHKDFPVGTSVYELSKWVKEVVPSDADVFSIVVHTNCNDTFNNQKIDVEAACVVYGW